MITSTNNLEVLRLITAGLSVMAQLQNGEIHSNEAAAIDRSIAAFNELEQAIAATVKVMPKPVSPFMQYSNETLENSLSGICLRELVINLGSNFGSHLNLNGMFNSLSSIHIKIALAMLESFAINGVDDPYFMPLYQQSLSKSTH